MLVWPYATRLPKVQVTAAMIASSTTMNLRMGAGRAAFGCWHLSVAAAAWLSAFRRDRLLERDGVSRHRMAAVERSVCGARRLQHSRAEADRDANQQCHRGPLRGHRQKRVDFGRRTFEHVGAPEVERHGRELERQADRDHQAGKDEHHERAAASLGRSCREYSWHASFAAIVGRWAEPVSRRAG